MSSLAASVGLPCPLSSASASRDGEGAAAAAIRQSGGEAPGQANLEHIAFPSTPHGSIAESHGKVGAVGLDGRLDTFATDKPTRHSLSDASLLADAPEGARRERTFSWESKGGRYEASIKPVSPATSSPPPPHFQFASTPDEKHGGDVESRPSSSSHRSALQNIPTVTRSECRLGSSVGQQQTPATSAGLFSEDLDEVFLLNPPPPSLSPSLKATNMTEALPPPPAPRLELDKKSALQTAPRLVFFSNSV